MSLHLDFTDITVSYRTFLRDLSANIVKMLHDDRNDRNLFPHGKRTTSLDERMWNAGVRQVNYSPMFDRERLNTRRPSYDCYNGQNKITSTNKNIHF